MRLRQLLVVLTATLVLAGCGGDAEPTATGGSTSLDPGTVTVIAAASLSDVFATIATDFEDAHPGVTVRTSFAASSTLAAQVRGGVPADVFAPADERTSAELGAEGLVVEPATVFARNRLAIAVASGNPLGISGLADLDRPDVVYIEAAPNVPISRYARTALADVDVTAEPVSFEPDVRAVLTKVSAGEADAGIVYATDIAAADGAVTGVELTGVGVVAAYPAAVLSDAGRAELGGAFVAFLLGPSAQRALADAGFAPPG